MGRGREGIKGRKGRGGRGGKGRRGREVSEKGYSHHNHCRAGSEASNRVSMSILIIIRLWLSTPIVGGSNDHLPTIDTNFLL